MLVYQRVMVILMALIEVDGLPNLNIGIFHGELLAITRWYMCHH